MTSSVFLDLTQDDFGFLEGPSALQDTMPSTNNRKAIAGAAREETAAPRIDQPGKNSSDPESQVRLLARFQRGIYLAGVSSGESR
jgi:hypothetical protein